MDSPLPEPNAGVFETMLVLDGRPVELDAHLERLGASLDALFDLAVPTDARDLVFAAASETLLGRLRLDVSPAQGNGVRVADVDEALVFPSFDHGIEVAAVTVPGGIGAHKWADRRLLEQAESDAGAAVPLILDADGTLLEGSRGSLFLVRDGVLWTPAGGRPVASGGHPGARDRACGGDRNRGARGGAGTRAPARGRRGVHDRSRARRGAGSRRPRTARLGRGRLTPRISAELHRLWFA